MTTQNPGFTPDSRYLENIIGQGEYGTEKLGPLASICEMPGGCRHGHAATNGVRFITVRVGGALVRLCGGCYEALRAN